MKNQERTFAFYENGTKEVFTFSQLEQIFINDIDAEQKENGTTFETWFYEMTQSTGLYQEITEISFNQAIKDLMRNDHNATWDEIETVTELVSSLNQAIINNEDDYEIVDFYNVILNNL